MKNACSPHMPLLLLATDSMTCKKLVANASAISTCEFRGRNRANHAIKMVAKEPGYVLTRKTR
jgi:hypothetical protein